MVEVICKMRTNSRGGGCKIRNSVVYLYFDQTLGKVYVVIPKGYLVSKNCEIPELVNMKQDWILVDFFADAILFSSNILMVESPC